MLSLMFALVCSGFVFLYTQTTLISAARQGARVAAVNMDLASNPSSVQTAVYDQVNTYFQQTTGQTLAASDVTVTGPTGATVGQRNVQVTVQYSMPNPLGVAGLLSALGGDGAPWQSFPVSATATMRYEE